MCDKWVGWRQESHSKKSSKSASAGYHAVQNALLPWALVTQNVGCTTGAFTPQCLARAKSPPSRLKPVPCRRRQWRTNCTCTCCQCQCLITPPPPPSVLCRDALGPILWLGPLDLSPLPPPHMHHPPFPSRNPVSFPHGILFSSQQTSCSLARVFLQLQMPPVSHWLSKNEEHDVLVQAPSRNPGALRAS
jgi:hypothetical protein